MRGLEFFVFSSLATRHGLDGLLELNTRQAYGMPTEPVRQATAVVWYGVDLLGEMAHHQNFPALTRRGRHRGARYVRKWMFSTAGPPAAIFFAHALIVAAVEFFKGQERMGNPDVQDASFYVEYHGGGREMLSQFYPLPEDDERALEECCRELRVFETGVPVKDIGVPRTGYGVALENGEDPGPELIESHQRYAEHIFRLMAQTHALRLLLPANDFARVQPHLLGTLDMSWQGVLWRTAIQVTWSHVLGDYLELVTPQD